MLVTIALGLLLAFVYAIFRWKRRKLYAFAANFRGPKEYPLLGSAPLFLVDTAEERFKLLYDVCSGDGQPRKVWFGPILGLVVTHPDDLEVVFNSRDCQDKPYLYKFFKADNGLFTANGDVKMWRKHRKLMNPSFNLKILKSFIPIFNERGAILTKSLEKHVNGVQFNFYEGIGKCTLDMICATTMGANLDLQNDSNVGAKFMHGIDRWLESVSARMFNLALHLDLFFKFSKVCRIQTKAMNNCFEITDKVIDLKKKQVELDAMVVENVADEQEFRVPQTYIDQLFHLAKDQVPLSDQVISDHIFTIIFGGHETSALTTANAILLLSMHPEIQDRVVEELKDVFMDADELPSYEHLCKMPYTEMVLHETMRIFPVGPYITRVTTNEVKLATSDLVIPEGVILGIPIYNFHHDPKLWGPDVAAFNPERFTEKNVSERHPYAYTPFGAGARICLGSRYAMMSMKILLANLLRKYEFSTTYTMDTVVNKFDITLKFNHPHLLSVVRRKF